LTETFEQQMEELVRQTQPMLLPVARPLIRALRRRIERQLVGIGDSRWEWVQRDEARQTLRMMAAVVGGMVAVGERFEEDRKMLGIDEPTMGDFWTWANSQAVEDLLPALMEGEDDGDHAPHRPQLAGLGRDALGEDDVDLRGGDVGGGRDRKGPGEGGEPTAGTPGDGLGGGPRD
jgi:hypothetical protein